ncbi:MAG: ribulokinase [Clostridiales bacterium]|nr:ribulokinase [Clostridiales bacterium]
MDKKYAIGMDFGTLSARAVLIDLSTGEEALSSVYGYQDAVIDEILPNSNVKLPSDYALQNPVDYRDATIGLLKDICVNSHVPPEDIISIGLDFTACTVVAVDEEMCPLCMQSAFARNPHSWVKLWKHHGAQREADLINQTARDRGENFIRHYGNTSSSEWMFAKILETYFKAPEVYRATYKFMEAGDWIVWLLTGAVTTSTCMAGFKAFWNEEDGYPSKEFFAAISPELADVTDKLVQDVYTVGSRAGGLTETMARATGLKAGTSVSVSMIDAHAAVPVVGATGGNSFMMTMGTSICHILLSKKEILMDGICGVVKDGVIPGYYGYEAGQAAVGDIYDWFITHFASDECYDSASQKNVSPFTVMDERAAALKAGESGLLALDWWNGNRSMLNNANLTGLIMGMTLNTRQEDVYRALIEATAFGTRNIVECMQKQGISVEHIYACGGLSRKSRLVMQIFADVLGRDITVTSIEQTTAYGAAMYGMVAAGKERGGFDTFSEASRGLFSGAEKIFRPDMDNHRIYSQLFQYYQRLTDIFGRDCKDVMPALKRIRDEVEAESD